jgi:2-C-methyl-D-erythritol 4-phosphate cytidylyltransferase
MSDVVAAIVLAAGWSSRMGGEDKLSADLGGEPVIGRALRVIADLEDLAVLVVVGPEERHEALHALVPGHLVDRGLEVRCVAGGDRRQDSVAAGIAAAPAADWYLVHDGARPLVTLELTARVLAATREYGAAVPGVPVVDTLKRVDDGGQIIETVERTSMRAVQTPQGFAGDLLREAHASVGGDVTDDASMVEALGRPVVVIEGDAANVKVTRPADLLIARVLLEARADSQAGEAG